MLAGSPDQALVRWQHAVMSADGVRDLGGQNTGRLHTTIYTNLKNPHTKMEQVL
jgi:hypothetical protein